MKKRYKIILSFVLIITFQIDCTKEENLPTAPFIKNQFTVEFVRQGGFFGGLLSKMRIDSSQIVYLESLYPQLQMNLDDDTYDSLFILLSELDNVSDKYEGCIDDVTNTIVFKSGDYTKIVKADDCCFFDESLSPDLQKIKNVIDKLNEVWETTYNNTASWIGLEYLFQINGSVFSIGDTLNLSCRIVNPTSIQKTIYFQHESKFLIMVNKQNDPSFHYFYPVILESDTSSPSQLIIPPNSSRILDFNWDLSIQTSDQSPYYLEIGKYNLFVRLFFNYSSEQNFTFEIVDPTIPLSGTIIPDYNGEDSSQEIYTFRLKIKNWTTENVTLNFPYDQKIFITLYDLNFPEPGPIIYTGPLERDYNPTEFIIKSSEEIVLEYEVNKTLINLNSMWTYVEIELLCDEYKLVSSGELRIFKYDP